MDIFTSSFKSKLSWNIISSPGTNSYLLAPSPKTWLRMRLLIVCLVLFRYATVFIKSGRHSFTACWYNWIVCPRAILLLAKTRAPSWVTMLRRCSVGTGSATGCWCCELFQNRSAYGRIGERSPWRTRSVSLAEFLVSKIGDGASAPMIPASLIGGSWPMSPRNITLQFDSLCSMISRRHSSLIIDPSSMIRISACLIGGSPPLVNCGVNSPVSTSMPIPSNEAAVSAWMMWDP